MRKAGAQKQSLKELLALRPDPPRPNQWQSGPPTISSPAPEGDDGFPPYDPAAFESDEDVGAPGGAFALLSQLGEEDGWEDVKPKARKTRAPPPSMPAAPAPAPAAAAPSGGPAAGAPVAAPSQLLPGAPAPRAPYTLNAHHNHQLHTSNSSSSNGNYTSPGLAPPRVRTHDEGGKPVSDTYYQTFQKVYRSTGGSVCMRFHKTDVVVVRPSGDIVLSSGGYRTRTTFCSVAEALEAMGLTLGSSHGGEGRGEWWVEDEEGATQWEWADGMTIPGRRAEDRERGERLAAAYGIGGGGGGEGGGGGGGDVGAAAAAVSAALAPRHAATSPTHGLSDPRLSPHRPAGPPASTAGPTPVTLASASAPAPAPAPAAAAAAAAPASAFINGHPPAAAAASQRLPPPPVAWSYRTAMGAAAGGTSTSAAAAAAPASYAPHLQRPPMPPMPYALLAAANNRCSSAAARPAPGRRRQRRTGPARVAGRCVGDAGPPGLGGRARVRGVHGGGAVGHPRAVRAHGAVRRLRLCRAGTRARVPHLPYAHRQPRVGQLMRRARSACAKQRPPNRPSLI